MATKVEVQLLSRLCATSGTKAPVPMAQIANGGTVAGPVQRLESQEKSTKLPPVRSNREYSSLPSIDPGAQPQFSGKVEWTTADYITAHKEVQRSGRYNFQGPRISVPTSIRYDRLREALGEDTTAKEQRTLELLQFGFPLGCKPNFGSRTPLKNHHSAKCFKGAIDQYLSSASHAQAILGPFQQSPIAGLCYSPLMTVPKEESKRRVIVDFSFPAGSSINDGILHTWTAP